MTQHDRFWNEYMRSDASARRILTLTVVVMLGAVLGYAKGSAPSAPEPATFAATTAP